MGVIYRTAASKSLADELLFNSEDPTVVREKIVSALNNPRYKSRTVLGISREAKLKPFVVIRAITKDKKLATSVKIIPMKSDDGRLLITTKNRFSKEASLKEKFVDFFASKRQEVTNAK